MVLKIWRDIVLGEILDLSGDLKLQEQPGQRQQWLLRKAPFQQGVALGGLEARMRTVNPRLTWAI